MKIVEEVEIVNSDKVFIGKEHILLTLDTETGRVILDAPAMFTNPVISLDLLEEKIKQLREHEQQTKH